MVKKSSFLDKLVNRFRSSSGVRVDQGRRRGHGETVEARATGDSRSSTGRGDLPARPAAESRPGRKLSSREDAVMVMNESFVELASLLRGVQVRMEDQGGRMAKMSESMETLPATGEAQLEVLKALVVQVEKQNSLQESMARAFGDLPGTMSGLKEALDRVSATDKRTMETLTDFRKTMDRIQTGMGEMVNSAKTQAEAANVLAKDQKASAEKLVSKLAEERREAVEAQKNTVRQLETSTQEGLKALRWAQEDQANRMIKLVSQSGKWNRAILVVLILAVAAMVATLVLQLAS